MMLTRGYDPADLAGQCPLVVNRAIKVTYRIIEGSDNLERGHYLTWGLWNILCHTFTGQDYRKYPGKYTVDKTLRKLPQAVELSDRCYSSVLEQFDIAMRSWWSNLKKNPDARPPKPSHEPRNLKFQIGRNAKAIGNFEYRLTVLGGKIKNRHAVVKIMLRPGIKMSQIKWLELMPDGTGAANIEIEQKLINGDRFAAIDLGIVNIAVVAFDSGESILYSGKGILTSDQWYQKRASACKPKGWSKGKAESRQSWRNRRYRRKAGNIHRLATHNLTRSILNECIRRDVGTIIIGDLKGIRDNADHGKRGNQKLHAWPFAEIKRQLEYKAEEFGIEVVSVSERNTSKCCHICGEKGVRKPRGILKCKQCNIIINSDVNGAFGILNKVSPVPVRAGVGVEADFPGLPSPPVVAARTGKVSQIDPTFVTKFDLRNWSMKQIVVTQ